MAISSVSTNYEGRNIDLSILGFTGVASLEELTADTKPITPVVGNPSRFCSGIQKLIQRYTINLLTELGSQPDDLEFGTLFITQIRRRQNSLSQIDVEHYFNVANLRIMNVFREYEQTNELPDDEALRIARLSDFEVDGDTVYIKIELITRSEEEVAFLIPLPI